MSRGLASTVAAAALLALTAATALAGSKPPSPVPAVAYQLNAQHTGATTDSVAATPTKQWSVTFSGGVSYPLITGGLVYVTVADSSHYGTKLYALSATTG